MQSWDKGSRRLLPGLCLVLLAVAGGCRKQALQGPIAIEAPAAADLEIREPQITLTPDAGTVYLTVVNPGARSDRLLRVETAAAGRAETHESVEENGVVRMVARPDGFEVPAAGTLALQPGGKHIMLVEPRIPADADGPVALTLHFEHAGAIEVQAALAGRVGMDHGGHGGEHDHGGHAGHEHGAPAKEPGGGG